MGIVFSVILVASIVWMFMDAAKHKIPQAGWWAFGGFLLWIVVFPWYLIQRRKMIDQAQEKPTETKWMEVKVITLVFVGAGSIWLQDLASEAVMADIDQRTDERVEQQLTATDAIGQMDEEPSTERKLNAVMPAGVTAEDQALAQQAMEYLFNHVCPRLVGQDGLFKEPMSISVGEPTSYQEERHGWRRVVSIEVDLSNNRDVLGKAAQHRCSFDMGKDGVYVKNTCAKAACQWSEEPVNGDMVTFRKDTGLSFIE